MTDFKNLPRKEKIAILRTYHEPTLQALGGTDSKFTSKSWTKLSQFTERKLGFFESELKGDIYFELTDFNQISLDPKRQLYRLNFDPNYATNSDKFFFVEISPTGGPQYYIDMRSCEPVTMPVQVELSTNSFISDDETENDIAYSQLTARDHACMILRVPQSNHAWLNDLIERAI